ncbi:MAG: hypothetical protein ACXWIN_02880 [Burkholderiaceae bacterium]
MDIEATWYEGSPYVYGVVGVASLSNYHSYIAVVSGIVLLIASATILRMRWTYRKMQAEKREVDERLQRIIKRKKQQGKRLDDEGNTIIDF